MWDMSQPNERPGECVKCRGTGRYGWGASINGQMQFSGPCHSCGGKGYQTASDIKRDEAYNRHKVKRIFQADDWR